MVDQGDAQPKETRQRELVNLGCLLPYQNFQWKCKNAKAKKITLISGTFCLKHFREL
jgi:hypothetical protein